MAKTTRQNFLELFLDGVPVIASSRSSNKHTSVIEAAEHAEEYAKEIGKPGNYEVRVNGGLYYMVRITEIVFDPTVPVVTPPVAEAELALDASSYTANENGSLPFTILRTGDLNSIVDIDWAITNATVTPILGTERFQVGIASILITVNTGEVGPTEVGDVTLANVQTISGSVNNTLGAQFTATITIVDLNPPAPGSQDLLYPDDHPWTHNSEPLGEALRINGIWQNTNTADLGGWQIVAGDMIAGTRQYKTTLIKNNGAKRTERAESRAPRNRDAISVIGDGTGTQHWKADQTYWYGFILRIDRADRPDDPNKGYYCQWHTKAAAGGSPVVALKLRGDGLRAYLEGNADFNFNNFEQLIIPFNELLGVTRAYIWEIFWDTRTEAEGSDGIVRLYLDDDPVSVFEWINKNNNQLAGVGTTAKLPYFKWGLYKAGLPNNGVIGDTYIQNHTNYVVHGENATRQGVLDSMNWDQRI